MVQAFDAVHLVLDLGPRRSDSELEPPSGKMVYGDRGLGQQRGVAVRVAGDKAPDPHAPRGFRHRRLQRPTFVDRTVGATLADRRQMVEVPHVIEAGLVSDVPDRAQLLDGAVLS